MTGRAVLVSGASRGIGLAAAKALAAEGFAVALNGPLDDDELRNAVREVRSIGVAAVAAPFDVADLGKHEAALDAIEAALGPLTTLVNNAGVGVLQRGDPLDVSEESWDRCLEVNAKAMFFLTKAFAVRVLTRTRNPEIFHAIVNVTSSNAVAVAVIDTIVVVIVVIVVVVIVIVIVIVAAVTIDSIRRVAHVHRRNRRAANKRQRDKRVATDRRAICQRARTNGETCACGIENADKSEVLV